MYVITKLIMGEGISYLSLKLFSLLVMWKKIANLLKYTSLLGKWSKHKLQTHTARITDVY